MINLLQQFTNLDNENDTLQRGSELINQMDTFDLNLYTESLKESTAFRRLCCF